MVQTLFTWWEGNKKGGGNLSLILASIAIILAYNVEMFIDAGYKAERAYGILQSVSYVLFSFYMWASAGSRLIKIICFVLLSFAISDLLDELSGRQFVTKADEYFISFCTLYYVYYTEKENHAKPHSKLREQDC